MQDHTPQMPLFTIVSDDFPPIIPITNKQIKDLTGQMFNRLTVLGYVGSKGKKAIWLCRCECGQNTVTNSIALVRGNTKSCGCLRRDVSTKNHLSHGFSTTIEYSSWLAIVRRCEHSNATGYDNYGGRGIKICRRWRESVECFVKDVGPRLGPEYSIDRIDGNGHYSCGHCEQCKQEGWAANCRWSTRKEQASNRRGNRILEYQGERLTMTQWAARQGMSFAALKNRVNKGWSIEDALTIPMKKYKHR